MKVIRHLSPLVSLEVEGETQLAVFDEISKNTEVFGIDECGKCKGHDIRYVTREVVKEEKGKSKTYTYRELRCQNKDCKARLAFGQHQEGSTLFPKRKNEDGSWMKDEGWEVWVPEKKE